MKKYIFLILISMYLGIMITGYIATQNCIKRGFDKWNTLGCFKEYRVYEK